jgi:hypothetical protein
MKITDLHPRLLGEWTGDNRLWLDPTKPERVSASRLVIAPAAKGTFITLTYGWEFEGTGHEGLLLVGNANDAEIATCAWADSFHTAGKVMAFHGTVDDSGAISVLGSYEAPPGPDWGWRITINVPAPGQLRIVMHNITPEGEAMLAVQGDYRRAT